MVRFFLVQRCSFLRPAVLIPMLSPLTFAGRFGSLFGLFFRSRRFPPTRCFTPS